MQAAGLPKGWERSGSDFSKAEVQTCGRRLADGLTGVRVWP